MKTPRAEDIPIGKTVYLTGGRKIRGTKVVAEKSAAASAHKKNDKSDEGSKPGKSSEANK